MNSATELFFSLYLIIYISVGDSKEPSEVVGGSRAIIRDFPHQVSIHVKGIHNCGGTLISHRHIVTAAHCVISNREQMTIIDAVIHSSTDDMADGNPNRKTHYPLIINIHDYYVLGIEIDVAIITLMEPIETSDVLRPIELEAIEGDPLPGSDVFLASWGSISQRGFEPPQVFQRIKLTVIGNEACARLLGLSLFEHYICTVSDEGQHIGLGDSGSGLIYNGRLVAVTSSKAEDYRIQISIRVAFVESWIETIVNRY